MKFHLHLRRCFFRFEFHRNKKTYVFFFQQHICIYVRIAFLSLKVLSLHANRSWHICKQNPASMSTKMHLLYSSKVNIKIIKKKMQNLDVLCISADVKELLWDTIWSRKFLGGRKLKLVFDRSNLCQKESCDLVEIW